jgi:ATP-dependent helicase HrpB
VLTAEPGAGKTTRVPPALLHAGVLDAGEVIVAQPRRIAARLAAIRVAFELGEPVGRRCGYQVRFDSRVSDATKIRFVTEGLLLRRLRDDPTLRGVAVVILDELHERHVDTDVALALLRHLQSTTRPDLRLVAMSATLDAGPVAAFLGARALDCPGRTFPVDVQYVERASDRGVGTQVAAGLQTLAAEGLDGSVLVFLPGAREIRDAAAACAPVAAQLGLQVVTLHGDMPPAAQDEAVAPGARPKLVLATNVAETSVTIDGVAAVVDTGLVRRASHDPWSGMPTLTLGKISRASAKQRAGRAGRTRAGRCLRLYPRHDHDRRPEHDAPDVQRLDLAGAMLDLRALGLHRAGEVAWLTDPPAAAVEAADGLLGRLGAIEADGTLTRTGTRMLKFPAHPRLARLLVEGEHRGIASLTARAAAVLSERSLRGRGTRRRAGSAAADVLADLDDLQGDRRGAALDPATTSRIDRTAKQLGALVDRRARKSSTPRDDLCIALMLAFPDRVARLDPPGPQRTRVVFAAGGDGELGPDSVVAGGDLVVAVAVDQRDDGGSRRTIVRSAAQIEPEWLLELPGPGLTQHVAVTFDPKAQRVDACEETRFGQLVIERTPCRELPPEATDVLRQAALARGVRAFVDDATEVDALLARVAFLRSHRPETTPLTQAELDDTLAQLCDGARSFAQVRRADVLAHAMTRMPEADAQALRRLAPTHVALGGGRRLAVHYEIDRPPWVQSRLQDFFGSTTGPCVADGRVPLVLHLLAPNQRAVQVTTDLASFWDTHYPALRPQLSRRYPKHAWPDDPRTASPPAPRAAGRRRRK